MRARLGLAGVLLVFTLAAPGAKAQAPAAAEGDGGIVLAQAEQGQRPGIFRFLFRRQGREVPMPQAVPQRVQPRQAQPPRQRQRQRQRQAQPRRERSAPVAPAPAPQPEVQKAEDAKRVLVIGDFMAGALAKGLADAYSENPNVVVLDESNGSSGLVRDDFFNWPQELPSLAEAARPDAVLVMIGANDRQAIRTAAGSHDVGSETWRSAYAARISALAEVLKATGKPVLWAGLVPVGSTSMSRDYSAFNGIVRERLDAAGLPFIETWNGFADEEGQFVASGPDISGQPVRLRTGDLGLNFTKAGQRKLAFFLEQRLNEVLGGLVLPELATIGDVDAAAPGVPAEAAPRIGPMVPLDSLMLATDSRLTSGDPAAAGGATAEMAGQLSDAKAAPPPGRADNFVWPQRGAGP